MLVEQFPLPRTPLGGGSRRQYRGVQDDMFENERLWCRCNIGECGWSNGVLEVTGGDRVSFTCMSARIKEGWTSKVKRLENRAWQ